MSKPRMLGQKTAFTPNSQADRRKANRTFQHREYRKRVQVKKDAEIQAALEKVIKEIEAL